MPEPLDFGLAVPLDTDPAEADDLLAANMALSIVEIVSKYGPGMWVEFPRIRTGADGHRGWFGSYLPDGEASDA